MLQRFMRASFLVFAAVAGLLVAEAGVSPASAGGGGCHPGVPQREGTGDTVVLAQMCFTPTVLRVAAGTTVSFRNDDQMLHHIAGAAYEWASDDQVGTGGTRTFTFAQPGTYPYSCYLHVGMTGAIVVGDGRAVAREPGTAGTTGGVEAVSARIAPAPTAAPAEQSLAAPAAPRVTDDAPGWLFATLGGLIGAVSVAALFGVKELRR